MDNSQNSLTSYLGAYVDAMFEDVAFTYTKPRDWKRDKTRLLHELKAHGSHVLTIMLPAICKSLDKALDLGQYNPTRAYLGKPKSGEKVPLFLRDLFIQVFDPVDGVLRSEPSLRAVSDLRQLLLGGKKILLPCSERRVRNELREFIKTENGNRRYTLDWGSDAPLSGDPRLVPGPQRIHLVDLNMRSGNRVEHSQLFTDDTSSEGIVSDKELSLAQSIFDWVASDLGDFSIEKPNEVPKHGPGAVSDLKRGMSKYSFRDWPSKLESIFPFDAYAVHDFMCSEGIEPVVPGRNREVPSKLISVPKTQKSPRLIAAEPSQYQWIQQLVRNQLEARIKESDIRHSVSFRSQEPNQIAAMRGSINGDIVSIDLSSASDRLTCWVVERFARSNWTLLDRLHACRTRWVRNSVDPNEWSYLRLNKYSTMGSAVIFPLQTIIYACLAVAAVIATSKPHSSLLFEQTIEDASLRVRVFGDDILLPKSAYECMHRLLAAMGLKVNIDKTYTGSNFRESCGVDAFRGENVSPVYLRRLPDVASARSILSTLEVSNNFWKRGYWHTASFLDDQLSNWDYLLPIIGPKCTSLGRFSFCGSNVEHLKRRWNARHHVWEVRAVELLSKTTRTPTNARESLLQWFTEEPEPDLQWEAGVDSPNKVLTLRPGWRSMTHFEP
jgi:hypothetical protein